MREIIDAKVQRWSIPPKKLSLQMGVGVSQSLQPIDVYNFGWMNIVFFLHNLASMFWCLDFILSTAVLQHCSAYMTHVSLFHLGRLNQMHAEFLSL